MEFETNERTDGQTRMATTSTDRRRHAVSTSLRLMTNGRMDGRRELYSQRPFVRPSLRWSLTLLAVCGYKIKVVYREPVTGPRFRGSSTGSQLSIISWNLNLHLNLPLNLALTLF